MIFYLQLVSGLIFFIYFLKSKKHFNFDDFIFVKSGFIITFVLSLVVASKLSLGWDSDFRWIIKALNFVQGNNIDNLKNLVDPEYPYLGSLLWGFFWKISF